MDEMIFGWWGSTRSEWCKRRRRKNQLKTIYNLELFCLMTCLGVICVTNQMLVDCISILEIFLLLFEFGLLVWFLTLFPSISLKFRSSIVLLDFRASCLIIYQMGYQNSYRFVDRIHLSCSMQIIIFLHTHTNSLT